MRIPHHAPKGLVKPNYPELGTSTQVLPSRGSVGYGTFVVVGRRHLRLSLNRLTVSDALSGFPD